LELLWINQHQFLADNQGEVHGFANAHQPTRQTRHVEMKHFIILQWTDDKFIDFVNTLTDENCSDSLSKPTGRTKFYKHTDRCLHGKMKTSIFNLYLLINRIQAIRDSEVCVFH
jgi:hypothetical protein